jgi:hypothetical protein
MTRANAFDLPCLSITEIAVTIGVYGSLSIDSELPARSCQSTLNREEGSSQDTQPATGPGRGRDRGTPAR